MRIFSMSGKSHRLKKSESLRKIEHLSGNSGANLFNTVSKTRITTSRMLWNPNQIAAVQRNLNTYNTEDTLPINMVVHVAEALGAFLLRVKSIGWNQSDCGGSYGGRLLRLFVYMNAYAALLVAQGEVFSIEDADKRVLETSAEVVCAQDLDLVEWSKESGNLSCGALRSLGCKFAGDMTEKKKKADETKLKETMNLTQYENRVKEAVCAWGKSVWKDYEYCIRIDAGRRVSKGMIKRGRGRRLGNKPLQV